MTPPLPPLPIIDLPTTGDAPVERADAARNRRRILAAAERLFASKGVSCTSMDAIAAEAGVGKGTLFRRFGDRASLVHALLTTREAEFQEGCIRGAPPLGPGAPAAQRIAAFGEAMIDFWEERGELLLAADGGSLMASPPWQFYRLHLLTLVREADLGLDAEVTTDLLLSALAPRAVLHLRDRQGISPDRLKAAWRDFVTRLLR